MYTKKSKSSVLSDFMFYSSWFDYYWQKLILFFLSGDVQRLDYQLTVTAGRQITHSGNPVNIFCINLFYVIHH